MNKITILAQAVGILALITAVISFQQRDIKKLILCQLLSNITFGIHFAMIGAYTGSVLNIISALRAVVFYFKGKKAWASLPAWPWIFIGLFAVSTAFTWEGALSILPFLGCAVYTYSLNLKNASLARKFIWLSSPMWLVYNAASGSVGGAVTEIINLFSIIIAVLRLDIKKKKNG